MAKRVKTGYPKTVNLVSWVWEMLTHHGTLWWLYISLRDRTWQWSSAQKISDFLDSGISAAPDRSTFPNVHNGPARQSGRGVQEGL